MAKKKSAGAEPEIPSPPRGLAGQRLRISSDLPFFGVPSGLTLIAPPDNESRWRNLNLDSKTLDTLPPAVLLELLVDLSPDISKSLWDFLRLMNPGWEVKALQPGTDAIDKRAQAVIDGFMATLQSLYGSADVVINRLNLCAFLRGGYFAELVLDNAGRLPIDVATPDPRWVFFRLITDPQRGRIWQPYQWQGGEQVLLDRPTIRYVPVDPLPGLPYGRSMAAPALFTVLFALGLLHDLRRVVSQQGYPRLDISVDLEQLRNQMPRGLENDAAAVKKWVDGVVSDVAKIYATLEPDDAYVHTNVVTVNRPVGTIDSHSLGAIDGLMNLLERQGVRATKTIPLLWALTEHTTETQANRQWECAAAGMKALQHLHEGLWEHMLTLALQAQGMQATVEFRFAELRAAELLRDSQVDLLQAQVALFRYQAGWIDQDSAAKTGAGVDKADQPAPRGPVVAAGAAGVDPTSAATTAQADPGSGRGLELPPAPDAPLPLNGKGHAHAV